MTLITGDETLDSQFARESSWVTSDKRTAALHVFRTMKTPTSSLKLSVIKYCMRMMQSNDQSQDTHTDDSVVSDKYDTKHSRYHTHFPVL